MLQFLHSASLETSETAESWDLSRRLPWDNPIGHCRPSHVLQAEYQPLPSRKRFLFCKMFKWHQIKKEQGYEGQWRNLAICLLITKPLCSGMSCVLRQAHGWEPKPIRPLCVTINLILNLDNTKWKVCTFIELKRVFAEQGSAGPVAVQDHLDYRWVFTEGRATLGATALVNLQERFLWSVYGPKLP